MEPEVKPLEHFEELKGDLCTLRVGIEFEGDIRYDIREKYNIPSEDTDYFDVEELVFPVMSLNHLYDQILRSRLIKPKALSLHDKLFTNLNQQQVLAIVEYFRVRGIAISYVDVEESWVGLDIVQIVDKKIAGYDVGDNQVLLLKDPLKAVYGED